MSCFFFFFSIQHLKVCKGTWTDWIAYDSRGLHYLNSTELRMWTHTAGGWSLGLEETTFQRTCSHAVSLECLKIQNCAFRIDIQNRLFEWMWNLNVSVHQNIGMFMESVCSFLGVYEEHRCHDCHCRPQIWVLTQHNISAENLTAQQSAFHQFTRSAET